MPNEDMAAGVPDLVAQLERLNKNIERDIQTRVSWKLAARNGLAAALGGVIGTSVVLSLVVHFVGPVFNQVSALRPILERLANNPNGARGH